ncbi:sulfatase-like hydrolase/transferase [Halorubrum ezzemoulense]|uniref:PglZ domain-containing protein n=1 Tax=Halorubrum ezzemoulense TaxID=337243 RepID=A0A481RIJ6_HALEZ|nr:sulfatase-like hydrolase/transferase [Halorubrum ezzemoulense]QAY21074.1 PglZ domain-containing protein [Halorubrum ezzemoulense]
MLDACRVDVLRAVSDEYDLIEDVEAKWSVGSTSKEWLLKTFTEKYLDQIQNTTYISGNGFTRWLKEDPVDYMSFTVTQDTYIRSNKKFNKLLRRDLVDANDFHHLEELWQLSENNEFGAAPFAEDLTNHAIKAGRERNQERLIVHYMQPHAPYLYHALNEGKMRDYEKTPFWAIRDGVSKDKVWDSYLDNLRYVLDSVELLLQNLDAEKVVITADHGELFSFGIGHAAGFPHPQLKKVPWVVTSATDNKTHSVNIAEKEPADDPDLDEHLQALGYK